MSHLSLGGQVDFSWPEAEPVEYDAFDDFLSLLSEADYRYLAESNNRAQLNRRIRETAEYLYLQFDETEVKQLAEMLEWEWEKTTA
jgi:hypothetical protein